MHPGSASTTPFSVKDILKLEHHQELGDDFTVSDQVFPVHPEPPDALEKLADRDSAAAEEEKFEHGEAAETSRSGFCSEIYTLTWRPTDGMRPPRLLLRPVWPESTQAQCFYSMMHIGFCVASIVLIRASVFWVYYCVNGDLMSTSLMSLVWLFIYVVTVFVKTTQSIFIDFLQLNQASSKRFLNDNCQGRMQRNTKRYIPFLKLLFWFSCWFPK